MNLNSITETIDKLLWGWPQIILLLGTHLFMSFKTGFIQKDIFKAIKLSVKKDPNAPGDVSQFGALTTALASTVGTANIIGVGTAIALGGPGAVLWIWFTGLFGIATKYAETIIAIKYRVKSEDGTMLGGAMYALDRGLNMKWLGIIFAILHTLDLQDAFIAGKPRQLIRCKEVTANLLVIYTLSRIITPCIGCMVYIDSLLTKQFRYLLKSLASLASKKQQAVTII